MTKVASALKVAFVRHCVVLLGLVACLTTTSAQAEFGDLLYQLSASDGFIDDRFGLSVDISGTRALVGRSAVTAPPQPDVPGAVYLYDLTTGQELRSFAASNTLSTDYFGARVALDGDLAVVGAPGANSGPGAAYLFNVTTGHELRRLTPSDGGPGDFGVSVAIDGNTAVVGARGNYDDVSIISGAAYVFDTTTGQERFKLTPSGKTASEVFGTAINGNIAVIGAPANNFAANEPGSAYLFDVTTGEQLFQLVPSDSTPRDRFGYSVGICDNIAIVGAPHYGAPGAAYLFDVSTGQELFKLTASVGRDEEFGRRVAISGKTAIVTDNSLFGGPGAAFLFDVETGQELMQLTGSGPSTESFGYDAAIDGNTVIVGADFWHRPMSGPGAAYVFDVTRTTVPEPCCVGLACSAMVLIGARRRCRR